jgi:uncharacterized protein
MVSPLHTQKPSEYNTFITPTDDTPLLLFNSLSRAIVAVSDDEHRIVQSAFAGNFQDVPPALLAVLESQGFMVPHQLNEREQFLRVFYTSMYDTRSIGLTVLTTMKCNMNCAYCYQRRLDSDMDTHVADALLAHISRWRPTSDYLHVTWMGGEPLLNLPIIDYLTKGFRLVWANYSASIVTNGALLSKETVQFLKESGVRGAQVTLDGPPHLHNRLRPFAHGGDSFSSVMAGLEAAARDVDLSVRINVDQAAVADEAVLARFMVDVQHQLGPRTTIYLSPVIGLADRPRTMCSADLPVEAFAEAAERVYAIAIGIGYDGRLPHLSWNLACGSLRSRNFVIAPDGTLYKCWDEPGWVHEQQVGDVTRAWREPAELHHEMQYLSYRVMAGDKCMVCAYQPVCAGGCPRSSLAQTRRGLEAEVCRKTHAWVPAVVRTRFRARKSEGALIAVTLPERGQMWI